MNRKRIYRKFICFVLLKTYKNIYLLLKKREDKNRANIHRSFLTYVKYSVTYFIENKYKMIGRAVTAFRKSVTKSRSSNTPADANDGDESIVSDDLQEVNVESHRRVSETSEASSRLLWLRKQRRSQSANREGDNK